VPDGRILGEGKWRLEPLYGNELKSGTIELETLRLRDMN
jgi:hypothetical protein